MAAIIAVSDLPTAIQSAEMVADMVAGANAKASRVAPCLVEPTTAAWAATTVYAVGAKVKIAGNQYLEVTTAGTSGAAIPTVPASIDGTVSDGTVTWKRISPSLDQMSEAKLVLLGAVKRWAEAGSGAFQSQQAGIFSATVDTRQRTGFNLWPSEISALQEICSTGRTTGAFSITPTRSSSAHMPWCSLMLGALYCSCGADLTDYEYPLYEGGVLSGDEY